MFLTPLQKERIEEYDSLSAQKKASFNFRASEKIRTFLDDIEEVNQTIDRIPYKNGQKAVRDEHIDHLFDLVEKVLELLDCTPIVPGEKGVYDRIHKAHFTISADGTAVTQTVTERPATEEEIARWQLLRKRLDYLKRFIEPQTCFPEYRRREYFGEEVTKLEAEDKTPVLGDESTRIMKERFG